MVHHTRENMEENYKVIKATKEFCFQRIKEANETLKVIREKCDHPKEHIEIVDYMWAPGHIIHDTEICGVCGDVILKSYIVDDPHRESDDPWTCDDCGNSVYNCKCSDV